MSVEKDIRYELLARLCPNNTGTLPVYTHTHTVYYKYIQPYYNVP